MNDSSVSRCQLEMPQGPLDFGISGTGRKAVYALCDPREPEIVRYVGLSSSPAERLFSHISWRSKPTPVGQWITALFAASIRPEIRILEIVEAPAFDGYQRELDWIARYDTPQLLNIKR